MSVSVNTPLDASSPASASPGRRPTLKDVARLAGVHYSTVSLVLKNSPRIPEETKRRVLQAIETSGYRRNPVFAALAARRTNRPGTTVAPGMAFLTNRPDKAAFDIYPHLVGFYAGVKRRAEAMGYRCQLLFVGGKNLSSHTLAAYLDATHTEGIVIGAMEPEYGLVELEWDRYAVVKIDTRFTGLAADFVSNDQLRITRRAHQRLAQLGYRRIGMAVGLRDEAMTSDLYGGAYCIEQYRLPPVSRVPPLYFGYHETFAETARRLRAWVLEHRVDAVMSNWANILSLAQAARLRVPDDVACACLSIGPDIPILAGMVPDYELVGSKAAESLALCLKTGQRGLRRAPVSTYVEGHWKDAASAPPVG